MWQKEVLPQVARHKDVVRASTSVKDAMRAAITADDMESNPAGVKRAQAWIDRIPANKTLAQWEAQRKEINPEVRKLREASPSGQREMLDTKLNLAVRAAQERAIEGIIFDELQRQGEPGVNGPRRRYAALSDIRDAAQKQMNQAEAFRYSNRIRFHIGTLLRPYENFAVDPSSGKLVQRGMQRLARSKAGVTPPRRSSVTPPPVLEREPTPEEQEFVSRTSRRIFPE